MPTRQRSAAAAPPIDSSRQRGGCLGCGASTRAVVDPPPRGPWIAAPVSARAPDRKLLGGVETLLPTTTSLGAIGLVANELAGLVGSAGTASGGADRSSPAPACQHWTSPRPIAPARRRIVGAAPEDDEKCDGGYPQRRHEPDDPRDLTARPTETRMTYRR